MTQIYKSILFLVILTVAVIFCYVWLLQVHFTTPDIETSTQPLFNVEEEQLRRHIHVANMCQILNINETIDDIPKAMLDHLIVDDEYKLIYCFVPKVACTNWKRVLLAIKQANIHDPLSISGNETHLPNLFKTLNQFSDDDIKKKLRTYLKFLFVRNPYERILSAYRNKFEYSYSNYFRTRYGTEIIKSYRSNPSEASITQGHDVTFKEYLQYITNLGTQNHKILFNEHWRPIVDLCFPCQIKYNILGKYETLETDANYVLQKAAFSDYIQFPKREQSYKLQPTSTIMSSYYKNVSKVLHRKLSQIYKEDFDLFEYKLHITNSINVNENESDF